MSRWTHVAGLVRIDSVAHLLVGGDWKPSLTNFLADALPAGSEGPLQFQVVEKPDTPNSACRGWVSIWGDLRDFGDEEEVASIKAWIEKVFPPFDKIVEQKRDWFVRQGIVLVEDEMGKNSVVWGYSHEEGWPVHNKGWQSS